MLASGPLLPDTSHSKPERIPLTRETKIGLVCVVGLGVCAVGAVLVVGVLGGVLAIAVVSQNTTALERDLADMDNHHALVEAVVDYREAFCAWPELPPTGPLGTGGALQTPNVGGPLGEALHLVEGRYRFRLEVRGSTASVIGEHDYAPGGPVEQLVVDVMATADCAASAGPETLSHSGQ